MRYKVQHDEKQSVPSQYGPGQCWIWLGRRTGQRGAVNFVLQLENHLKAQPVVVMPRDAVPLNGDIFMCNGKSVPNTCSELTTYVTFSQVCIEECFANQTED